MKKNIKLAVLFLSLLIISPVNIHADCQSDFNAIADKFKATYKYNEETDDYTITLVNPNMNRYWFIFSEASDIKNKKNFIDGTIITSIISNYKGTEYHYGIMAEYDACKGTKVKDETLLLRTYNPYADDPLCKGNEEFVLCQKDYKEQLTKEEFTSRLETYLETKQEEIDNRTPSNKTGDSKNENGNNDTNNNWRIKSKVSNDDNVIDIIIEFMQTHILLTIIAFTVLLVLIIMLIIRIKKTIKSRRLE